MSFRSERKQHSRAARLTRALGWAGLGLLVLLVGAPVRAVFAEAPAAPLTGGASELHNRLTSIDREARELDRRTAERGRAYVRLTRLGLLPMSDGFDGLVRHAQRVRMLGRLLQKDVTRRAQLKQQSTALQAVLADLKGRPQDSLGQLGSYSRSKEAILAAKEREAAYERAFRSKRAPEGTTTVYGSVGGQRTTGKFAAARGRLAFPVEGRAHVRELPPNSERGPGLVFEVDGGASPRSIFRGKVVLVGDYGSLGQAIVIEHGDGYSSLTANLKNVYVEAGHQLPAGAPLGELRGEGERELYFELRKEGAPVPPAEWFGL